jgi:hypothetical protein
VRWELHSRILKTVTDNQSVTVSDGARVGYISRAGGIWFRSHRHHYKLSHTVSLCISTHISLISYASLILMQLRYEMRERAGADRISNFQNAIRSDILK